MAHPARSGNYIISENAKEGKEALMLFLDQEAHIDRLDEEVYASDGLTFCLTYGMLRDLVREMKNER